MFNRASNMCSPRSRERGPVEASLRFCLLTRDRSLRAHVSAAPLKHVRDASSADRFRHSPRSRERGPVEARRPGSRSICRTCSPRSRERGPVEASQQSSTISSAVFSPRSRERGPVEAPRPSITLRSSPPSPRSRERGPVEAAASPQGTAARRLFTAAYLSNRSRPILTLSLRFQTLFSDAVA